MKSKNVFPMFFGLLLSCVTYADGNSSASFMTIEPGIYVQGNNTMTISQTPDKSKLLTSGGWLSSTSPSAAVYTAGDSDNLYKIKVDDSAGEFLGSITLLSSTSLKETRQVDPGSMGDTGPMTVLWVKKDACAE